MTKLVLGAFDNRDAANNAIEELQEGGVPHEDFSVITREGEGNDNVATEGEFPRTTTDAATIGGSLGGLTGLVAGAVSTAGFFVGGPALVLIGLGWVALTTVAGGAVGAAAGGLLGALVSLGISEDNARRQESIVKSGGVLLGVEDNRVSEQEILNVFLNHAAEDVASVEHQPIKANLSAVA